jgi:hypothetical protein
MATPVSSGGSFDSQVAAFNREAQKSQQAQKKQSGG